MKGNVKNNTFCLEHNLFNEKLSFASMQNRDINNMEWIYTYIARDNLIFFIILQCIISFILLQTRMTTFIKTKFKISDDQTNIDKYRLAINITKYPIKSKLILQRIIITNCYGSESHLMWTSILESPSNFQVHKQEIGFLWSSESFEVKYNIDRSILACRN